MLYMHCHKEGLGYHKAVVGSKHLGSSPGMERWSLKTGR